MAAVAARAQLLRDAHEGDLVAKSALWRRALAGHPVTYTGVSSGSGERVTGRIWGEERHHVATRRGDADAREQRRGERLDEVASAQRRAARRGRPRGACRDRARTRRRGPCAGRRSARRRPPGERTSAMSARADDARSIARQRGACRGASEADGAGTATVTRTGRSWPARTRKRPRKAPMVVRRARRPAPIRFASRGARRVSALSNHPTRWHHARHQHRHRRERSLRTAPRNEGSGERAFLRPWLHSLSLHGPGPRLLGRCT